MTTAQVYYDNNSVVDIAKEAERSRGIKRAQAAQQKKQKEEIHMQQIAQGVNTSRQNMPQSQSKTQAQLKHELKQRRKADIQSKKAKKLRSKGKQRLIKKYQKDITKYDNMSWTLLYTAVAVNILGGLLVFLFGLGYLFIVPATLYIDIKVWFAFNKMERYKISTIVFFMTAIKVIPIVGMLPTTAFTVYVAQKKLKEKRDKSRKRIKILSRL